MQAAEGGEPGRARPIMVYSRSDWEVAMEPVSSNRESHFSPILGGNFMSRTGGAGRSAVRSEKKICFVATDRAFLVELLYELSLRPDCCSVKYSTFSRDGMYLGSLLSDLGCSRRSPLCRVQDPSQADGVDPGRRLLQPLPRALSGALAGATGSPRIDDDGPASYLPRSSRMRIDAPSLRRWSSPNVARSIGWLLEYVSDALAGPMPTCAFAGSTITYTETTAGRFPGVVDAN